MSLYHEEFDLISQYLFADNKPITYKVLSRSFRLSNSTAKDILKEYYERFHEDKQDMKATYVLTGVSNGNNLIKLSNVDSLDQDKKLFDSLYSCSVYSLNSNSSLSFNNIVAVNLSLKSKYTEENCDAWGVLRTQTATPLSFKDTKVDSEPPAKQQQHQPTEPVARPGDRKSVTEPAKPTASKVRIESSGVSSLYRSRKVSSKPKTSTAQSSIKKEEPKKSLYTSRKKEARNRVVIDGIDDDQDEIEETHPVKRTKVETIKEKQQKKSASEAKMKNFFNDDDFNDITFSDEENKDNGKTDSIDVSEKEPKETKDAIDSTPTNKVPQKSNDAKPTKKPASTTLDKLSVNSVKSKLHAPESNNEETQSTQEFIKTVDENGFTVITKAKNYVSPETRQNTNTPKGHTISSVKKNTTSGKGSSSKKQSSLMSFFNAKKK